MTNIELACELLKIKLHYSKTPIETIVRNYNFIYNYLPNKCERTALKMLKLQFKNYKPAKELFQEHIDIYEMLAKAQKSD